MKEPKVLTVAEAAQILRVSKAFVYNLVARGDLAGVRLGRRIVIPGSAIHRLIDDEAPG